VNVLAPMQRLFHRNDARLVRWLLIAALVPNLAYVGHTLQPERPHVTPHGFPAHRHVVGDHGNHCQTDGAACADQTAQAASDATLAPAVHVASPILGAFAAPPVFNLPVSVLSTPPDPPPRLAAAS
jgi:hypothetical protein